MTGILENKFTGEGCQTDDLVLVVRGVLTRVQYEQWNAIGFLSVYMKAYELIVHSMYM